jgi:hypothetical protein
VTRSALFRLHLLADFVLAMGDGDCVLPALEPLDFLFLAGPLRFLLHGISIHFFFSSSHPADCSPFLFFILLLLSVVEPP